MGLIKALTSSTSSTLGDQFKEFITCPDTGNKVLIQSGLVQHGKGNKNPSEGIITKGSAIVVPEGMCMMIVDNGAITEFTAEPGTFTYDNSTEPTIFEGGFFKGIGESIKTIGKRITYGGQTAHDQRVYYINTKVIPGNKFGSPQPKKITDEKYGMIEVTFFGEYAFQVVDPVKLVVSVIGSTPRDSIYYEDVVGSQLKTKFIEKITEAISIVMRRHKVSFGDMGMYGSDISNEMNICLNDSWKEKYGLIITDVAIGDINLTDESMKRVNKIDDATIFSDKNLQSGLMANAASEAMVNASKNESGAMMGFAGMNMAASNAGSIMNSVNSGVQTETVQKETGMPENGTIFTSNTETPKEENNNVTNTETPKSKFCSNCGTPVTGKFCSNCGVEIK